MSRLEELIAELCPDGVEYRSFGELATILRGASPRPIKNFITSDDDGVSWIKIGDVAVGSKYITHTKEKITTKGAEKSRKVKKGDFILSNSMSFGRPYILSIDGCIHDGWLAISDFKDVYVTDFLYHLLNSTTVQREMAKRASFGGAVQNLNADIVKAFVLPVPPLSVQSEIVRILDNFTELTAKLTAELTAELTARKKQYQHYLNSFFETQTQSLMPISELGTLTRGKRFVHADATDEGVPCIHYGELYTYYGVHADVVKSHIREELRSKMRYAHKGDVIIVGAGENNVDIGVGVAWEGNEDVAVHDACYTLSHTQNAEYISYYLRSDMYHDQIKKYVSEGKICSISAVGLGKTLIPIPSMEEQNRIVSILERFDNLCNDISAGIPAEIEARQKQYEYYRDKLLTFKKLA